MAMRQGLKWGGCQPGHPRIAGAGPSWNRPGPVLPRASQRGGPAVPGTVREETSVLETTQLGHSVTAAKVKNNSLLLRDVPKLTCNRFSPFILPRGNFPKKTKNQYSVRGHLGNGGFQDLSVGMTERGARQGPPSLGALP